MSSRLRQRMTAAIAVGVASAALLTGCVGGLGGVSGGPGHGQDAEVVEQHLEAVEGVASATVEQDEYSSGPSAQRTSIVHVALADGYRVGDPAAFEWLARTAWAVDDDGPTTSNLMFGFTDAGGTPIDWDWSAGAVALGLDPDDVDSLLADQGLVDVVASTVPSSWGPAPGPLPEAPTGAIVPD
ncbi:hypothetical protein NY547_09500 [Cnuibacter physcomitrellae]|uniref:hypothetical protein n=1 Tax=Cnuibacter physcomitrellae TaxID=1619308 RepID=UPI00217584F7|nr:hypothetical protein [Cnuibacter physcomitrellae]MCS5497471.1 hypothetical protein [Cnuibacter physcomitrellae]